MRHSCSEISRHWIISGKKTNIRLSILYSSPVGIGDLVETNESCVSSQAFCPCVCLLCFYIYICSSAHCSFTRPSPCFYRYLFACSLLIYPCIHCSLSTLHQIAGVRKVLRELRRAGNGACAPCAQSVHGGSVRGDFFIRGGEGVGQEEPVEENDQVSVFGAEGNLFSFLFCPLFFSPGISTGLEEVQLLCPRP